MPEFLRLSLEDCLILASKNHAKLKGQDLSIEAALWQLNEAKARFWPIIDYQQKMAPAPTDASNAAGSFFSGDITFFNNIRVGVGLPLYAFGQLTMAQRLAKQGISAAKENRDKEEREIHYQVKQLYYGILLGRELKEIAHDALHKINKKLMEASETGELSPYKMAKLKVFKLDLEKRLDEAYTRERIAWGALRIQIGFDTNQPFALKKTYLSPAVSRLEPLEYYLNTAGAERPDVHLVNIGVEAKRLQYVLEKKKMFPQIGFGGFIDFGRTTGTVRNVNTTDDFNNPFNFTRAGVGLEMRGKLDFHGSNARIKRLNSEYLKADIEASLAKSAIALEVEEAYREVVRFREDMYRMEEKGKLARQMLFLSKSNLELGVGEEGEYTDALQLVLQTRGEYFKAVFDYNVALSKLDWKVGKKDF